MRAIRRANRAGANGRARPRAIRAKQGPPRKGAGGGVNAAIGNVRRVRRGGSVNAAIGNVRRVRRGGSVNAAIGNVRRVRRGGVDATIGNVGGGIGVERNRMEERHAGYGRAAAGREARRTMTKHDISGGPHDKT